jgi:succinoglycan biosynthesis transport protein ExoP
MSTAQQLPPNVQPLRGSPPQLAAIEDETLDLRRIAATLRRRKVMIAAIGVVGTMLSAFYVSGLTPLYKAESTIVVEPERKKIVNIDQVAQNLTPDWLTPLTEAAIIRSRDNALLAVERLDLVNHPAFNASMRPRQPGMLEIGKAWLEKGLAWAGIDVTLVEEKGPVPAPQPTRALQPAQLVGAFLGGLETIPVERSRLIRIVYTSTDPALAADAANAVAELYIDGQKKAKGRATSEANSWLDQRVREVHQEVIKAQQKRDEFRRQAGIIELGEISINAEQLADMNSRLIEARTVRQQAEARYSQVAKLTQSSDALESVPEVLSSALIQTLRLQQIEAERNIAELATQFRDGHPKMVLARAELADVRAKLQAEVKKIASQLQHEVDLARSTEGTLSAEVQRLQQKAEEQNDAKVTLDLLESELQASKQLYETLLARYKETEVQDDTVQRQDARIISAAIPPGGPFYPQKKLLIGVALAASLVIGVILAISIELLDYGFRSLSQIEGLTGLPTLGMVPMIVRKGRLTQPHQLAVAKPGSVYGEAVRTLRTALLLSDSERPPRTVLVTSSIPNEGKTSTALSIACQSAKSGQRCIILDCDLRQSSVHKYFGVPNNSGLADYLVGKARLEEVIEIDPLSGAHLIPAGARAPNPIDLLGSPQMRRLIKALSQAYDLVILDTPPVLAVSDALVLVRHVDATLFLIRWEKTRRQAAISGLKIALEAGANLAGVVLSQVDVKRHAQYDYADSGYYYGGYNKYYTEA